MPNAIYAGHAFGYTQKGRERKEEFELAFENRDKLLPWIKEYSPIELATADDSPIYLNYPNQKTPPVIGEAGPDPTHSAIYGIKLKEKLDSLGVESVLAYPGHPDETYGSVDRFFIAKLKK